MTELPDLFSTSDRSQQLPFSSLLIADEKPVFQRSLASESYANLAVGTFYMKLLKSFRNIGGRGRGRFEVRVSPRGLAGCSMLCPTKRPALRLPA